MDITENRRRAMALLKSMPVTAWDEVLETLAGIREYWIEHDALPPIEPPEVRRGIMTIGPKSERPDMIAED